MAQEQGRFSPAQILMAAEKAESDGRMDHAIQFYRYIAEQQSGAPEADIARLAMDRLISGRALAPKTEAIRASGYPAAPRHTASEPQINGFEVAVPHERTGPPSRYQPAVQAPSLTVRPGPHQSSGQPAHAPASQPHAAPQAETYGAQPTAGYGAPRGQQRAEAPHGQARMPVLIRLPSPRRGYRMGRALAMSITIFGVAAMLVGVALVALTLFAPRELGRLGPGLAGAMGIGGSLGSLLSGAVMLLLGQLARAVFDGANAMRELVSIERAMARHNARPTTGEEE